MPKLNVGDKVEVITKCVWVQPGNKKVCGVIELLGIVRGGTIKRAFKFNSKLKGVIVAVGRSYCRIKPQNPKLLVQYIIVRPYVRKDGTHSPNVCGKEKLEDTYEYSRATETIIVKRSYCKKI